MLNERDFAAPINRRQAARIAAAELFIANAEAGDNRANDALVAELCHRTREQQHDHERHCDDCPARTGE